MKQQANASFRLDLDRGCWQLGKQCNFAQMVLVIAGVLGSWIGVSAQQPSAVLPQGEVSGLPQADVTTDLGTSKPSRIQNVADDDPIGVSFGLGGLSKLGHPTLVTVRSSDMRLAEKRLEVQTVDGDGVAVTYRDEAAIFEEETTGFLVAKTLIQTGRRQQPIIVRVMEAEFEFEGSELGDSSDTTPFLEKEVTIEERGTVLPSSQPWLVEIGDFNLKQLAKTSLDKNLPTYSVSTIDDVSALASSIEGYAGVDLVFVSTKDFERLANFSEQQSQALVDWVATGGRLVLSVGLNIDRVSEVTWLRELIPGDVVGRVDRIDPGPLESWVNAQQRLGRLSCAEIIPTRGKVLLSAQTAARDSFPLLIRGPYALGQVVVMTTDLDSSEMMDWDGQAGVLTRLFDSDWVRSARKDEAVIGNSLGYNDLAGQLRATLDVYPNVVGGTLSLFALILAVFLLWVGPFDFWFWVKKQDRPSATWLSMVVLTAASCFGIIMLSSVWRPAGVKLNQVSVLDIDTTTGVSRQALWIDSYSGHASTYDMTAVASSVDGLSTENSMRLDWLGQPGSGIGGFESTINTDRGMPAFLSNQSWRSGEILAMEGGVVGVGVPASGTKCFQAVGFYRTGGLKNANRLTTGSGNDLLDGAWANPLDVPLLDAVVLFQNLQYTLKTRIQPGETVTFSIRSRPKDLTRYFQRRQFINENESGQQWDPASRTDLDRLMQLTLFHQAAGGVNFTKLENRYLKQFDLSDHLELDVAVVFARLEEQPARLEIKENNRLVDVDINEDSSWVRLLVPVER